MVRFLFDGKLSEIVHRFADFKMATIQCAKADLFSAEQLKQYGDVTEQSATGVTLKVKRDRVIAVCKSLLDDLPVTDIDIQGNPD